MKAVMVALILGVFSFSPVFAEKSEVVVAAIDYSCAELQEIVNVHGVAYVEGLGSRNVYSHAEDACEGDFPGDDRAYWFASYWESNDSTICRAGYGCRTNTKPGDDKDDDLGEGDIPDGKK